MFVQKKLDINPYKYQNSFTPANIYVSEHQRRRVGNLYWDSLQFLNEQSKIEEEMINHVNQLILAT